MHRARGGHQRRARADRRRGRGCRGRVRRCRTGSRARGLRACARCPASSGSRPSAPAKVASSASAHENATLSGQRGRPDDDTAATTRPAAGERTDHAGAPAWWQAAMVGVPATGRNGGASTRQTSRGPEAARDGSGSRRAARRDWGFRPAARCAAAARPWRHRRRARPTAAPACRDGVGAA